MTNKSMKNQILLTIILTLAASFIYAISSGIRNNYGIMFNAIIENTGLSYSYISLVLAFGQLFYGAIQPLCGILAEKKGNAFALIFGICFILIGLIWLPHAKSKFSLMLSLGLFLSAGTGIVSYGLLIGSISTRINPNSISTVSGIVNASSGIGNAALSPIIQFLLAKGGIASTMLILSIPTLLLIPICFFVGGNKKSDINKNSLEKSPIKNTFTNALKDKTYILLMAGFFTCGFHMALIMNHLPKQFIFYGITSKESSYAFALYGIITIIGSVISGSLCGKYKMKNVLGSFYGARVIIIILFLILPKTIFIIFGFAFLLGFTGMSTVPPVSGIINLKYGAKSIATLYGIVFFIHQIGAFLGAYLGGVLFERFLSYNPIWIINMILCIFASTVSFMIKD